MDLKRIILTYLTYLTHVVSSPFLQNLTSPNATDEDRETYKEFLEITERISSRIIKRNVPIMDIKDVMGIAMSNGFNPMSLMEESKK